jgi:type IV pilus assembly protein PilN
MIRINLLPVEEARRAAGRRQELAVGMLGVAAAVFLFVVAHGWQQARIGAVNRELRHLNVELVAIQGPYADVTRLEQQKQELRDKLRVIAQLEAKKVGPVRILADLSSATPDKLWLTEFADAGGSLKLAGLGVDEQTVADFLRRLATLPFFRSVDLDETSQVDLEGAKLKQFVIHAKLDYEAVGAAPAAASASAGTPGATTGGPR